MTATPSVVIVDARPSDDPAAPFVFAPADLEIPVGSTVRWVNGSETFHTVTFSPSSGERVSDGTFDASMFEVGSTIAHTFDSAGEFRYFCQPHFDFMAGSVRVVEPPGDRNRMAAGIAAFATAVLVAIVITRRSLNPDR